MNYPCGTFSYGRFSRGVFLLALDAFNATRGNILSQPLLHHQGFRIEIHWNFLNWLSQQWLFIRFLLSAASHPHAHVTGFLILTISAGSFHSASSSSSFVHLNRLPHSLLRLIESLQKQIVQANKHFSKLWLLTAICKRIILVYNSRKIMYINVAREKCIFIVKQSRKLKKKRFSLISLQLLIWQTKLLIKSYYY